jgi:hypothetical protein
MFNHHNLPKSLLNEVANLIQNTQNDFDLPNELQEIVAEAAADYILCPTHEDRKAIIEWHIDQVTDINNLDSQTIVNFQRAVEHAALSEGKKPIKKPKPEGSEENVVGGVGGEPIHGKQMYKEAAEEKPGKVLLRLKKLPPPVHTGYDKPLETLQRVPTGEEPGVFDRLHALVKDAHSKLQSLFGKKDNEPTKESYVYGEYLEVLSSLNEQEFEAYINILTEREMNMLENILQQTQNIINESKK